MRILSIWRRVRELHHLDDDGRIDLGLDLGGDQLAQSRHERAGIALARLLEEIADETRRLPPSPASSAAIR